MKEQTVDLLKKWRAEIAADPNRRIYSQGVRYEDQSLEHRRAVEALDEAMDDHGGLGRLDQAARLRIYDAAIARLEGGQQREGNAR